MADVLQKLMRGDSDAAINSASVPKELAANETDRNLLYKHLDGVTVDTFFSKSTLSKISGDTGASLIGNDNAGYNVLNNITVQGLMTEIDAKLFNIPWVIVRNRGELIAALELSSVVNIWCEGISWSGFDNISVTSSKRIYAPDLQQIIFLTFAGISIDFPTSGSSDIFIDFYANIDCLGSNGFGTGGGFAGAHIHAVRYNSFTGVPSPTNSGTNITFNYESTDVDLSGITGVVFSLWSGVTQGKLDSDTTVTPTAKHRITDGVNGIADLDIEDEVITSGGTLGQELYIRNYNRDDTLRGKASFKSDNITNSTSALEYHVFSIRELGVMQIKMAIDTWGHLSINQLPDPWSTDVPTIDLGDSWAEYSFTNGSGIIFSGKTQHAYMSDLTGDVETWRFKTAVVRAHREDISNGISTKLESSSSGSVDGLITWIPARYDAPFRRSNYTFDGSSTTDSDPGSTMLRANNGALTSATELYISDSDVNGISQDGNLQLNTADISEVILHDAQFFGVFNVTLVTNNSGYTKLTGTFIKWTAGFSIVDNDNVVMEIIP